RVELRALLDVLRAPDATQVDQVSNAIGSLTPPSACGDSELLAATEPVPDAPAMRAQVTEARAGLARVDALAASGKYKEAADLGRELSKQAATIGYAPLIAEIDGTRGRILIDLHQWDEAKAALDNGQLAAERGRHHYERGNIVLALIYLAMQRNDPEGALVELKKADAIVTGLGGATANRARIEDYRSQALASLGKIDEAKVAAEKAVALYEEGEGKDTISLSSPLTQLAYVAYQKGDLVTSVKLLDRTLQIQLRVFGTDHPRIGIAHTNLAFNLSAADRLDEAQQHAEAAQTIYAASLGESSEPYAEASRALVGILQRRGKLAEAEKLAREVVAKLKEPKPTTRYANALDDLGAAVMAQHRADEALKLRQEALAIREQVLPPGHPSTVSSQIDVGDVLAELGRCKEALPIYEAAQKLTDGPEVPPYLAIAVRIGRGRCLVETHHQAAALQPLREALARNEHPEVVDDRKLRVMTNFELAQALWPTDKAGSRAAAKAAQAEASEIHAEDLGAALATWVASH
ncbi:MAG: tetratricopeptide repeat protein, partial [Kofleriaceae bacterium]|nr:tetratricopeptide repeat protein [Kofleriaceae bacterium]